MGKVNVVIVDATGNKEQKVGLPDDIKCGIIMVKLVEKIKLPSVGPDGNPISYKFIHKVTGRQLLESQTLAEAGIKDGDVLRLQPEITAGAKTCASCGAVNEDTTAFCVKCGTKLDAAPAQPAFDATAVPPQQQAFNGAAAPQQPYNAAPVQGAGYASTVDKLGNIAEKNSKLVPLIGVLSGIVSVILGIITMLKDTGVYVASKSYGGDAYTGIQNAAADTAYNVKVLAEAVNFGIGSLLIVLGVAIVCYFALKMKK